jgi:sialic acid synthase SpsE
VNIAGVEIGAHQPCRTVAELSNNHNGSSDLAHRLIDAAKEAGADFVKFQAYQPDELVALRGDGPAPAPWGEQGWTVRDLYRKAQTPLTWFPALVRHCDEVGMPWFASVFGYGSFMVMEALGCPAYKLAALDYGKRSLLAMVQATGKPLIRSCANEQAPRGDGLWLFCPPGYPQTSFGLRRASGYDGFSFHGTNACVPILAATLGASLIECHLQSEDAPSELEANVSLDEQQFADMVRIIRENERLMAA